MGLLWELYQHGRIRRIEQTAAEVGSTARRFSELDKKLDAVDQDVDRTMLALLAGR